MNKLVITFLMMTLSISSLASDLEAATKMQQRLQGVWNLVTSPLPLSVNCYQRISVAKAVFGQNQDQVSLDFQGFPLGMGNIIEQVQDIGAGYQEDYFESPTSFFKTGVPQIAHQADALTDSILVYRKGSPTDKFKNGTYFATLLSGSGSAEKMELQKGRIVNGEYVVTQACTYAR